jgi:hypothetical protein
LEKVTPFVTIEHDIILRKNSLRVLCKEGMQEIQDGLFFEVNLNHSDWWTFSKRNTDWAVLSFIKVADRIT